MVERLVRCGGRWSVVVGRWSLVVGRWSLVVRGNSRVLPQQSTRISLSMPGARFTAAGCCSYRPPPHLAQRWEERLAERADPSPSAPFSLEHSGSPGESSWVIITKSFQIRGLERVQLLASASLELGEGGVERRRERGRERGRDEKDVGETK